MPYWQLFYHVVWTTEARQPFLTPQAAPVIYGLMRSKTVGLEGTVYAIGGMPDHVHLVVAIPPKIAVATFIGQVKGDLSPARFAAVVTPYPSDHLVRGFVSHSWMA